MFCDYMDVCHMCVGACQGQRKASGPLELELSVAVSHPMWVMGAELWSSERATSILNPLSHLSSP